MEMDDSVEQEPITEHVKNRLKDFKNSQVYKDIFSHPITGSYEHKDENGNWVEGPSLGHGYHGGYDEYNEQHKSKFEKWLEDKGVL